MFGSVSSAHGASVPGGWQDVITGEIYAGPGTPGVAGSRGHYKQRIDGVWHDYPSPTITVNGTTYTQGADGGSGSEGDGHYQKLPYGYFGWEGSGACGGGPAYGAHGGHGGAPLGRIYGGSYPEVHAYAGDGGWGATALPPDKETARYGQGGRGGNGGGGGGSPGIGIAEQATDKKISGYENVVLYAIRGDGLGGDGSAGGQGADGCIILYLRQARRSVSGWAKDSNNRWRLDRLGRRCIV